MEKRTRFLLSTCSVLLVLMLQKTRANGCDSLTKYSLTFHGEWTRDRFPKMYPMYRPPAQWSKLLGRSHSRRYRMWEMDKPAQKAAQQFAETGISNMFDDESRNASGLFDVFLGASISEGAGSSTSQLFVDGKHSQISFMVRIVPSPDWFVGVHNLDLCEGETWVDSLTIDLGPLDTGTDDGYTFTSPNWPSEPHANIHRLTARDPSHPANSFFYPRYETLPRIAYVSVEKVAEYVRAAGWRATGQNPLNERAAASGRGRANSVGDEFYSKTARDVSKQSNLFPPREASRSRMEAGGGGGAGGTLAATELGITAAKPTAVSGAWGADVDGKTKKRTTHAGKRYRTRRHHRKGSKKTRSCKVTAWGEWTPCSKTCGFGVRARKRQVMREARNGGQPCPNLTKEDVCGTMKDCGWHYFSWS